MKLYYFIIWNHGIQHIVDILSIIRNTNNVKINKIIKIKPDLNNFLNEVYKFDKNVSKKHIERKKDKLLTNNSESFLILVENYQENISQTKSGTVYCKTIDDLKWNIREKFNPRYDDKHYDPYPGANKLSKGITHNHICHSCDRPIETPHILKTLHLYDLDYYIGNPCKDKNYLVPSRLKKNFDFTIKNIHIDSLRASIIGNNNIILIEDTPHYKYLTGDKEIYNNYVLKHLGSSLKDDHLSEAYDKLIMNFDYNKLIHGKKSLIIVYDNYRIKDGLHRASILKYNNVKYIDVMILLNY